MKNLRKETGAKKQEKDLVRRYLLWCYKTTKEDLDWIDRKFTQLKVDRRMLKELMKGFKSVAKIDQDAHLTKIEEFKDYIAKKEERGLKEKFLSSDQKQLQPQYVYLQNRLHAIQETIVTFLGAKGLRSIQALYEQEMTRRILEAREHT
jgi:hypothetical protein